MKTNVKLTLVGLVTVLGLLIFAMKLVPTISSIASSKGATKGDIKYVMADGHWPLSLNPQDSDLVDNTTVMEMLVGTLVRYEGIGRYSPFLAEKWEILDDGLRYRFYFRKGLKLENGEDVDAVTYIKNFKRLLRKYSTDLRPPVFSSLVGFDEFIAGADDALSVHTPSLEVIEFAFREKVFGFFEYISMPYFGYYSSHNFDDNGNWIDNQKIIASGPYRVKEISKKELVLAKRRDWFSHIPSSPEHIIISSKPLDEALKINDERTAIGILAKNYFKYTGKYLKLSGTPSMLSFVVLSSLTKDGVFKNEIVRKEFAIALQRYIHARLPDVEAIYPTRKFFFDINDKITGKDAEISMPNFPKDKKLSIMVRVNQDNQQINMQQKLILKFLEDFGIKYEVRNLDRNDKDYFKKIRSNDYADIRFGGVDIGGEIESWCVRMMFCSTLGVGLPDINGKICKLTDSIDKGLIDYQTYKREFESTVKEEATVIPLYLQGQSWFFSDDIDISRLTPTMGIIPWDQVGVKN